ncbi:hypothetical protein T09_6613 [Trichinella sp. T9]|nr:hypothetical protein T09_6613 [Trichinella sp. T9]
MIDIVDQLTVVLLETTAGPFVRCDNVEVFQRGWTAFAGQTGQRNNTEWFHTKIFKQPQQRHCQPTDERSKTKPQQQRNNNNNNNNKGDVTFHLKLLDYYRTAVSELRVGGKTDVHSPSQLLSAFQLKQMSLSLLATTQLSADVALIWKFNEQ